jgi:hypothetical protein
VSKNRIANGLGTGITVADGGRGKIEVRPVPGTP